MQSISSNRGNSLASNSQLSHSRPIMRLGGSVSCFSLADRC
jgi:hypothetical protein